MFIHGVLLQSASWRQRCKMQGVDDRMQPEYRLHASLVWPRLNAKLTFVRRRQNLRHGRRHRCTHKTPLMSPA